jgi:hypothetical protein
MPHREIRDVEGIPWEVWQVTPTMVERRETDTGPHPVEGERRIRPAFRAVLPQSYREGWLAFRSPAERRRLAPVPQEWDQLTDTRLLELLALSEAVGEPRRLIE